MAMSKDRVHFKLIDHQSPTDRRAQAQAAAKAFKINEYIVNGAIKHNLDVICRPSQFARFLIYRGEFGGQNLIKALHPCLVTPEPPKPVPVDVSGNPA